LSEDFSLATFFSANRRKHKARLWPDFSQKRQSPGGLGQSLFECPSPKQPKQRFFFLMHSALSLAVANIFYSVFQCRFSKSSQNLHGFDGFFFTIFSALLPFFATTFCVEA